MDALEFINIVHNQLGYPKETDVAALSDEGDMVLPIVNAVVRAMQNDKAWPELRTQGQILMDEPTTSDAYATVTYGDNTLTLTGGTDFFEAGDVGKVVQVGSYTTTYRIATYTSAKEVELETPWREDNDTLQTIVMAKDRYSMPSDFDWLPDSYMLNQVTQQSVQELTAGEMRAKKQTNGMTIIQEEPQYYTIHGEDSNGYKYAHFDRLGGDNYVLEFDYQKQHPELAASTDEILYPDKYVLYMVDRVVAIIQRDIETMQVAAQTMSDALREGAQINKNPDDVGPRMKFNPRGALYGAYRRR